VSAFKNLPLNIYTYNIHIPKVVVEDYFVPALNTMCEKQNIPDDVAGATFMAAGASAPEMFAAFLSLFVTHSAIGVGTILGSELFNHLIITAGSIFYANEGTIQTEPRFVGRECMCVVTYRIHLYLLFSPSSSFPPLFSGCSVSFSCHFI
jgi:Ca2+/Na+ antiporter